MQPGPLERGKKGSDAVGQRRKLLCQILWPPCAGVVRGSLRHVVEEPQVRCLDVAEGLGEQVAHVDPRLVFDTFREDPRERLALVAVSRAPGRLDDTDEKAKVLV